MSIFDEQPKLPIILDGELPISVCLHNYSDEYYPWQINPSKETFLRTDIPDTVHNALDVIGEDEEIFYSINKEGKVKRVDNPSDTFKKAARANGAL